MPVIRQQADKRNEGIVHSFEQAFDQLVRQKRRHDDRIGPTRILDPASHPAIRVGDVIGAWKEDIANIFSSRKQTQNCIHW